MILGLIVIILGLCFVAYDLFPIYQFKSSRSWPLITSTITEIINTGILFRLRRIVTFSYSVEGKNYKSTQMMPKDSWVQGLNEGGSVQIRYCTNKPGFALIDHSSTLGYALLACWNLVWIIVGLCIIFKQ